MTSRHHANKTLITFMNSVTQKTIETKKESTFMVFQVTEFKHVIIFPFVWCRDVMTSCHDVTKLDLPISACRCARKLILFLFSWIFRSVSSNMLLIFYLSDDVTSWRHVMTSQNLVYSSQLVDVLKRWFFLHWDGLRVAEVKYVIISVFAWWHHVMSYRYDVLNNSSYM